MVNLKRHITVKCKTAMYSVIKVRNIRKSLTVKAAHNLVLGTAISHLDYANALHINLPDVNINKLQRIQNIAVKLVLGACIYDSATECLHHLHWLPIRKRIQFKVLLLIFKAILLKTGPQYIEDMFELYREDQRTLRSNSILYHIKIPVTEGSAFATRTLGVAGA